MPSIPLGRSAYKRENAREPEIRVFNRFFETNPVNTEDQVALILRPALKKVLEVGDGPIRKVYTQPGVFSNDLFVISGSELFRVHRTGPSTYTSTKINGTIAGTKSPSVVATGTYLMIADGTHLQYTDGTADLDIIPTPDGIPIISIDYIAGYVICVQANSQRFYWIEPGELEIEALNFAEAERNPDNVRNVTTIGDQFWLFGDETTEVWYPTGDAAIPFQRIQGRLYDRGIWAGTVVRVKDQVVLVGNDGIVYGVTSGPNPISPNGITERIRNTIEAQTIEEL